MIVGPRARRPVGEQTRHGANAYARQGITADHEQQSSMSDTGERERETDRERELNKPKVQNGKYAWLGHSNRA